MEFDKTAIAIKQRSLGDTLDLSLLVFRRYFWRLLAWSLPTLIPAMVFNHWILSPFSDFESLIIYESDLVDEGWLRIRYLFLQMVLVYFEAPLLLLGTTYFLGIAIFTEKPLVRGFRSNITKLWFSIAVIQGVFRIGIILPALFALFTFGQVEDAAVWMFFVIFTLGVVAVFARSFRPFSAEILILESTGLWAGKPTPGINRPIHYALRARNLHSNNSTEFFMRTCLVGIAVGLMLTSITLGQVFIMGIFLGVWEWGWWMDQIVFPINLWLVAIWATVIRLLSYIDCRTRQEGWELCLKLMAESHRVEAGNV